jgi:hypothetical protein
VRSAKRQGAGTPNEVHFLIKVAVKPASSALRAPDGRQGSGAKPFRIAFAFCGERNDPARGDFTKRGRVAAITNPLDRRLVGGDQNRGGFKIESGFAADER